MKKSICLVGWVILLMAIFHTYGISQVQVDASQSKPACEGQCNGSLTFKVSEGTVTPLTIELRLRGTRVQIKSGIISEVTFTDLCSGAYNVEVTSEHPAGCKAVSLNHEVSTAPFSIATLSVQNPTNPFSNDGHIEIDVLGSSNGNYNVQWATNEQTKKIEGLSSGFYNVSVTDANLGCTLTKQFQLQPCYTDITVDQNVSTPDFDVKFSGLMPNENTPKKLEAHIRFDPLGKYQPLPAEYSAKWYVNNQLVGTGSIFLAATNLTGAEVTLIVTDACGKTQSYTKSVINCESSSEDFKKHIISKIDKPCGPLGEGGVLLEFASGLGDDINLELIRNESNEPIFRLGRDGVSNNHDGASYFAYVGGLKSDTEYRITGFLGYDCPIDFAFTIPYEPTVKKLVGYRPESYLCLYDEFCNGKMLDPSKNYREAAFINFDEINSGFLTCNANIYCKEGSNYIKMQEKRAGWKEVSGIEWQEMLIQSRNGSEEVLAFRKAVANPCAKFNICIYDPLRSRWGLWEDGVSRLRGCSRINNCLTCVCRKKFNRFDNVTHTACADDLVTPPPPLPRQPFVQLTLDVDVRANNENLAEACKLRDESLLQMIDWHKRGELKKLWDGSNGLTYEGSELEKEILKHVFKNPVTDRSLRCAAITFCKNDLNRDILVRFPQCDGRISDHSFVEYCDINKVFSTNGDDRDSNVDPKSGVENFFASQQIKFVTFHCRSTGGISRVNYTSTPKKLWDGEDLLSFNDQSIATNEFSNLDTNLVNSFIADSLEDESLLRFGYIRNNSVSMPKGILHTNQGNYYSDYSYGDQIIEKIPSSGLVHSIEYWDTNQDLYAFELLPNRKFGVIFLDTLGRLDAKLESSESLKINTLAIIDSNFVLAGFAKGNLSLDSSIIGNIPSNSMFILELTRRGQINRFHVLEGIDTLQGAKFTEIQNGTVGLSVKYAASQPLLLNGNPVNTAHNHGVLFATSASDTFTLIKDIAVGSEVQVKQISLAKNASQLAFVLSSADSLNLSIPAVTNGNNLVLGAMSNTGFLKWGNKFPEASLNKDKLALTHGDSCQLFLGLSFLDTLNFQNQIFYSQGEEDVLILKYGYSGDLSYAKPFGSPSKETITHLFYDANLLVFGGDLQGSTPERVLGVFKITNQSNEFNRAYMAALIDTTGQVGEITSTVMPQDEITTILTTEPKQSSSQAVNNSALLVNVYPNPFRNEFTLEVNARQTETLTLSLIDNLGKTVKQSAMPVNAGYNAQVLNTAAFPSGIYFLHLKDATGRLIKTHRVVKL